MHLEHYKKKEDAFLHRIIVLDEAWAQAYKPEMKWHSNVWRHYRSPPKTKVQQNPSNAKVMVIFAYDSVSTILTHAVPQHRTVTGQYYTNFLEYHLRHAFLKKRPHFLGENTPIILHDNTWPHVIDVVKQLLVRWQWEVLYHLPKAPDISPCDFDFIPIVKEPLCGRRFKTIPNIIDAVGCSIWTINKTGAAKGIM